MKNLFQHVSQEIFLYIYSKYCNTSIYLFIIIIITIFLFLHYTLTLSPFFFLFLFRFFSLIFGLFLFLSLHLVLSIFFFSFLFLTLIIAPSKPVRFILGRSAKGGVARGPARCRSSEVLVIVGASLSGPR